MEDIYITAVNPYCVINTNEFPEVSQHNIYLTLYAPCIILKYVHKPTKCIDFIFH